MFKKILFGLIFFIIGSISTFLTIRFIESGIEDEKVTDWFDLPIPDKGIIGYSLSALKADIQLPRINEIKGKVKFKKNDTNIHFSLGYKIEIEVDTLDNNLIPKKYRHKREINHGLSILPVDEVMYEMVITFRLLDQDGFILIKKESEKEYIWSGQLNKFQEIIRSNIAKETILELDKIELYLRLDKCVTCSNAK